ncbi:MAG: type III secretion system cytoplasmic ring protein SctQ [Rhabdochlamydiaceae bacterium]|nr:type III secretion system cytoplasmic ring protein SctQ [Candidatus Amphrikana amoebophyrae]
MKQQWIKHLTTCVEESQQNPIFGHPPTFDLDQFNLHLKETLHLENLTISVSKEGFRDKAELLSALGEEPSVIPIALSPISNHLFWAMSQSDIEQFSSWTLTHEQKQFNFTDPDMQKGYYYFCITSALLSLRNSQIYSDLSPKIEKAVLVKEKSFTLDICLTHDNKSVWGRIIIPIPFQLAFKQHYSQKLPSLKELKSKSDILITTPLIAGSVSLITSELKALNEGDFIVLDQCTFHPNSKKGYLQLNLSNHPLFQLKLKEDHLKVLDYAYEIEGPIMDYEEDMPQDSQPIEDILEDSQFGGGLQSDDLDMDEPSIEDELDQEESPLPNDTKARADTPLDTNSDAPVETMVEEKMVHPNDIPLTLTVEVAKLKLSLEKLLELQPGSVLNTSIHPERGVNLTVNGRLIGKGELLQVGDALGVKIIEIAN